MPTSRSATRKARASAWITWDGVTPVFDGATEAHIEEALKRAGLSKDGKTILYDGRSGERRSTASTRASSSLILNGLTT